MAIQLIEHNPLLKRPVLEILSLSEKNPHAHRNEIEDTAKRNSEECYSLQTPTTIVDILIRNGAIEEQIYVDGEPIEGSLQDVQTDASVSDDAVIDQRISLTDEGKELLDEYVGEKKMRELLASKPHYKQVFISILEACTSSTGSSRTTLERTIDALPQLAPDENGTRQIYPQYFIDSLETAGGITWQGAWHITDEGRTVMDEFKERDSA